jgi:hypothetical protein
MAFMDRIVAACGCDEMLIASPQDPPRSTTIDLVDRTWIVALACAGSQPSFEVVEEAEGA